MSSSLETWLCGRSRTPLDRALLLAVLVAGTLMRTGALASCRSRLHWLLEAVLVRGKLQRPGLSRYSSPDCTPCCWCVASCTEPLAASLLTRLAVDCPSVIPFIVSFSPYPPLPPPPQVAMGGSRATKEGALWVLGRSCLLRPVSTYGITLPASGTPTTPWCLCTGRYR